MFTCDLCGGLFDDDDLLQDDRIDGPVCIYCKVNFFFACHSCGEMIFVDDICEQCNHE